MRKQRRRPTRRLAVCAGVKRPTRVPVWLARDQAVVTMTDGRQGFKEELA